MAKTSVWQLPYPSLADAADIMGVDGVDDLAARLEVVLSQIRAAGSIPGEVKLWPNTTLPTQATYGHWVWADGTSYSSTTYPLANGNIAAVWKTFGGLADPGAGNFRVPDLRGVAPSGMDAMPGGARANRTTRAVAIVLAGRAGEEYHTITVAESAAHAHAVSDPGHAHSINDPGHYHGGVIVPGVGGTANTAAGPIAGNTAAAVTGIGIYSQATGVTVQSAGGGGAHENIPPTVFVPYIVKLDD
jgi:microcystin-dependent protein